MIQQTLSLVVEYSDDVPSVDIRVVPVVETIFANHISYVFVVNDDYITEEEYPLLAEMWDNDDDAIFDNM